MGMMMKTLKRERLHRYAFLFLVLLASLLGAAAHAATFGTEESIHKLVEVSLTGPRGESLYLGYRTTTKHFLAGYSVQDDGYILGINGEYKKYYPMPRLETVTALQQLGQLPTPLPAYTLSLGDYIWGYLLWIIIPITIFAIWAQKLWQKRKRSKPGYVDLDRLAIQSFMEKYLASPPQLPMVLRGDSLVRGGNDLILEEGGFAFTSISGKDLKYWADVAGFGLTNFSGRPMATWRYSSEFRGIPAQYVSDKSGGISQMAPCGTFVETPLEIVGLLNAVWLLRRDHPIATPAL